MYKYIYRCVFLFLPVVLVLSVGNPFYILFIGQICLILCVLSGMYVRVSQLFVCECELVYEYISVSMYVCCLFYIQYILWIHSFCASLVYLYLFSSYVYYFCTQIAELLLSLSGVVMYIDLIHFTLFARRIKTFYECRCVDVREQKTQLKFRIFRIRLISTRTAFEPITFFSLPITVLSSSSLLDVYFVIFQILHLCMHCLLCMASVSQFVFASVSQFVFLTYHLMCTHMGLVYISVYLLLICFAFFCRHVCVHIVYIVHMILYILKRSFLYKYNILFYKIYNSYTILGQVKVRVRIPN